ncbi:MAG TPA: class I SAM-dependent methyltransferase [Vicinamibacterales bacterium]
MLRLRAPKWLELPQPLLTIDHPAPCQHFAGWVDVRGWAAVADGAPLVLRISVDDRLLRVVRPDKPRPDVAAAYPGLAGTDRCGFETRLTRDELPDRDHFILTFELHVDGWIGRVLQRAVSRVAVQRHASAIPLGGAGQVDHYVTSAPDPRHLVDIFAGEWSSRLPPPFDTLPAGPLPLFEDPRVAWAITALGGVAGQQVLEIGPLEGGHTWMLERAGAERIVAIEANARAFLRCLLVKELVGLPKTTFLLGDALAYLEESSPRFDAAIAAGVLYHMKRPGAFLRALANAAPRMYVWTCYYDPQHPPHGSSGTVTEVRESDEGGFRHTLYRVDYPTERAGRAFCGGTAPYACWMTREDILGCVRHAGLTDIEIAFDETGHEYGASFGFVARRP